ncbi:GNAT family N-acetyltransferase [Oerskovia sp. Sa1BUA8]|uniref:GNAT family N-acetyltransferase n=1 Tax=Oerskovia douganii TaxID=2762210 RepID=A0A9D5UA47_9CELL|nr:GNAT family N-acetyltransferase [Oerskovia douganii]MBE7700619.1 GNAT family N-acetyltransferase [Oerskovia douganii]
MTSAPTTRQPLAPIAERAAPPAEVPVPQVDGLTWRPLAVADAPALFRLVSAVEEHDQHPFRTSLEETEEIFEGDWRDLPRDTLVGLDADGEPRAYASVDTRPGDTTVVRAFVQGAVHPQWRGRAVGRQVLAWSTARARQLLAASGKELPARIAGYVQDDDAPERRLFEAAGFTATRFYSTLRRDLSLPVPEVTLGEGLRVVPWTPELDEATRLAHNDAFRDHWGSEPATPESWVHGRSMFAPEWSVLVVDDTPATSTGPDGVAPRASTGPDGPVVAGYLLSGRYEQDWPVAGYSSGYTETLGVRRDYRGRKIAVALLSAGMAAYKAGGVEYAELDVDTENPSGAHGLYASLGYEKKDGSRMYSIEL